MHERKRRETLESVSVASDRLLFFRPRDRGTDVGRDGGRANFLSPSVCCHDRELLPREGGGKAAGYGGAETISDEHVPPPKEHTSVSDSHSAKKKLQILTQIMALRVIFAVKMFPCLCFSTS